MKKAVKYIYDTNPFCAHWKKHICPKCGGKVELGCVSKIVNPKSPEAKDYDFSVGDTFFVDDVEFRTRCFYCPNCRWGCCTKPREKQDRVTAMVARFAAFWYN